jgi:demethylmenaquinone methyltransferase / 2-methoxy-6-polyprenyl-1,4-benzoquinol methylase
MSPLGASRSAQEAASLPSGVKEKTVQRMFSSIAHRYDLNNSLLSLGRHHAWKQRAVDLAQMQRGMNALDLCSGTADLAILLAKRACLPYQKSAALSVPQTGRTEARPGRVIAVDLNEQMLTFGKRKIEEQDLSQQVLCLRGHAEQLHFKDQSFDLVTVAFGIRNLDNISGAFAEICRVLKPGGRVICLEFSKPLSRWLRGVYDLYSFRLLPFLGTVVSRDKTGVYWYLPASIRNFPDQDRLKEIMLAAGFRKVEYTNLTGGIVAIHVGWR